MHVILMGYMGSGKSTIGRILAGTLDFKFIDLDDYISEKEGIEIPQLFKEKGELYFRKIEHQYLHDLLNKSGDYVISLGGGTPCYANNLELIKNSKHTQNFYLKASLDTLTHRLFSEKNERPLIQHLESIEELQEFIAKHLFERSYYYNQANVIIEVDKKATKDITEELVFSLF